MRNMSFMLTPRQILRREKTVTRRTGWIALRPGTLLQPVRKSQGLKRGEKVEPLGVPIRVVSVAREPIARMLRDHAYGVEECRREGFPDRSPLDFVRMFCETHDCEPEDMITRIEFDYARVHR